MYSLYACVIYYWIMVHFYLNQCELGHARDFHFSFSVLMIIMTVIMNNNVN